MEDPVEDAAVVPVLDLRDRRARLIRLGIAVLISLGATFLTMRWIDSVSSDPNPDPVGKSTVGMLAIAVFVVNTAVAHAALSHIARRER